MEHITFEQLPKAVIQLYNKLDRIERLLMETRPQKDSEADQFLTVQKAASYLHLSAPTIYSMVSKAEIPVNKKGKRLYFSKKELEGWIKEGRKKTIGEIEGEAISTLIGKKKGSRI